MSQAGARSGDHVAVLGGGVIGGMCAWYLSQAGFQVTIVDRERFGAACSHGNCDVYARATRLSKQRKTLYRIQSGVSFQTLAAE